MKYEIIRYLICGAATTFVNISVFSGLRYAIGTGMQTANCISIVTAIVFAFVVSKWFVFRSDENENVWREFIYFAAGRGGTLLIEVISMQLLTVSLHIPEMAAKIFLQIFVIVVNYVISKMYVFKRGGESWKK